MIDRGGSVKAALLAAPLLVAILALHAWGDAMSGGLSRSVADWQYPERGHGIYRIRAPRRSQTDDFASKRLEEFVDATVKTYGTLLSLHQPRRTVQVILPEPETDLRRFGLTLPLELRPNESAFDAERRLIIVRTDRDPKLDLIAEALREAAARLLLHDAGSDRWSPWLTEGLVGRLEGPRPADPHGWTGDLPTVTELLSSRASDYASRTSAAYARGARLLLTFLLESKPEAFAAYYKEERAGLPAAQPKFTELLGDPGLVDAEWKSWLQRQK
jgi:hypothetical protein